MPDRCSKQKACFKQRAFLFSSQQGGFTVVELVVVMVVIGIISATAIPRFFSASGYETMAFVDESASAIRYARTIAVNTRCDTRIEVSASGYQIWQRQTSCSSGGFTRAATRFGGDNWAATAPGNLTISGIDIYFDAQGRPHQSSDDSLLSSSETLTVNGRTVTVYTQTGFVQEG